MLTWYLIGNSGRMFLHSPLFFKEAQENFNIKTKARKPFRLRAKLISGGGRWTNFERFPIQFGHYR